MRSGVVRTAPSDPYLKPTTSCPPARTAMSHIVDCRYWGFAAQQRCCDWLFWQTFSVERITKVSRLPLAQSGNPYQVVPDRPTIVRLA